MVQVMARNRIYTNTNQGTLPSLNAQLLVTLYYQTCNTMLVSHVHDTRETDKCISTTNDNIKTQVHDCYGADLLVCSLQLYMYT